MAVANAHNRMTNTKKGGKCNVALLDSFFPFQTLLIVYCYGPVIDLAGAHLS